MKCSICGNSQFRVSMKDNSAVCMSCHSVYSLDEVADQLHEPAPASKPVSDPRDFEIVGGVLKRYHGSAVDVVVPVGVVEIAGSAMSGQMRIPSVFEGTHIKSVVLPEGLRIIGKGAFVGCRSLEKINIPESVTQIHRSAFERCSSLISVEIPSQVTVVSEHVFWGCEKLVSVTIPNGVTRIEVGAFSGCQNIKNLKIPTTVSSVGAINRSLDDGHIQGYSSICGNCPSLIQIDGADRFPFQLFQGSAWAKEKFLHSGLCPKCGSQLSFFGKKCKTCNISY